VSAICLISVKCNPVCVLVYVCAGICVCPCSGVDSSTCHFVTVILLLRSPSSVQVREYGCGKVTRFFAY
jgi:hypothetical protein